ncbi:hypothetical protein LCGC14_1610210 [marine sediment metagenome]|uniref:Uncharacterized protein n=1 Tax=marine sediment metagenome TaxID=412755 RepID=A0A0F9I8R2_9ZZZZ
MAHKVTFGREDLKPGDSQLSAACRRCQQSLPYLWRRECCTYKQLKEHDEGGKLKGDPHEPAHLEGHMEKGLAQGFVLQGRPRGPAGGLLLDAIGYLILVSAVIIVMLSL